MVLLVLVEALLLGGAALCIFLMFYVWRQRTSPSGRYFCALLLAGALYAVSVAFEFMASSLEAKILWSKVQYIPGVSLAPLWFLFAMAYGNHQTWLTRRRVFLIWVIPVVALLGAFTNEYHHWIWTKVWLVEGSPYGFAAYKHGPLVWMLMWYSYALMAVASLIMVRQTFRSASLYPSQTVALIVGALLPWVGNIISATGLGPWQGFEIAALTFLASGALFSWGILRFHLFRMTSVAYDTILASMDEAVVIVDEDGRIAYLNAAARQVVDVDDNYVDTPLAEAGMVGARLAKAGHGTSIFCVDSHCDANPTTRYFEVTETDLKTTARQGRGKLFMYMVRDITARKKAEEEALRGQESMQEFNRALTILNQVSNELATIGDLDELCKRAVELGREQLGFERLGIWFLEDGAHKARGSYGTDEQGMLRDERQVIVDGWNGPGIERLLDGQTPYELSHDAEFVWRGEYLGKRDQAITPMWDGKRVIGHLCADNLITHKPFTNEQCQVLALFANSLGHLCSVRHAQQEQRQLEVELHQAQKMEAIGQLAGGVAHDFNNMLAVVLGYTEMAMKKLDAGAPVHSMLLQAQKTIQRTSNLTRQLLAFARREMVVPRVVNLNETVAGAIKILQRLIGENVHLVWKPGPDLWSIRIDPAQVDQILINLLVNARDAIDDIGAITIETGNVTFQAVSGSDSRASVSGEYVLLAVGDSGKGMDKTTLEHLFEPFFTTKEAGKGTGLGLSTVYGIVKQNGGQIDVSSELGKGTMFRIYLPRFESREVDKTAESLPTLAIRGTETVLMVEDEPAMLDMGRTVLEELGYTVLTADNPSDALRIGREHAGEIDIVVTDVVMPGMSGRDLTRELVAIKPGLKCLYVSGYAADVIAKRGILDDGVDFLHKPFSLRAFAERVRATLDESTAPAAHPGGNDARDATDNT